MKNSVYFSEGVLKRANLNITVPHHLEQIPSVCDKCACSAQAERIQKQGTVNDDGHIPQQLR